MTEGTQEDWDRIVAAQLEFYPGLADRVMTHLGLLAGDYGGFVVDRLVHSTQTATRAMRANRSDDYIACALLHDIGDTLGSFNHPDVAAAIIKPFVSEEVHWICANHGAFQGYYYFHFIGGDRDVRENFRSSPYFEACAEFCEKYDQAAFDPDYDSEPLDFFEPMLRRVMARPINSMYAKVAEQA